MKGNPLEQSGTLRPMLESDLDAVMAVELRAYPHPWSKKIFSDCLNVGYACLVYEEQGELLAYGVLSSAAGEAHVLNLCVAPESQGKGLGRYMLLQLIDLAQRAKARTVFLEVRFSNSIAQLLYHSMGFNELGVRPNYYPNGKGREDAMLFALSLEGVEPFDE